MKRELERERERRENRTDGDMTESPFRAVSRRNGTSRNHKVINQPKKNKNASRKGKKKTVNRKQINSNKLDDRKHQNRPSILLLDHRNKTKTKKREINKLNAVLSPAAPSSASLSYHPTP